MANGQEDLQKQTEKNVENTKRSINNPPSILSLPEGVGHEGQPGAIIPKEGFKTFKQAMAPKNAIGGSWDDYGGTDKYRNRGAMIVEGQGEEGYGMNVSGSERGGKDRKLTLDDKAIASGKEEGGGTSKLGTGEGYTEGIDKVGGKITPTKKTGLRSIDVSPALQGKYGEKIFTNRDSGDVFGKMEGSAFRGGKIKPGTGMTDEQISEAQGAPSPDTIPKGRGGKTLPPDNTIAGFNARQDMQRGERNPFDISNPKNLTEGKVRGGELGWAGFGGTLPEQAEQEKIANQRRDENMKVLSQYLGNNSNSMRQIQQQLYQAQTEHYKALTARENEKIEVDKAKLEFARDNPETRGIIDRQKELEAEMRQASSIGDNTAYSAAQKDWEFLQNQLHNIMHKDNKPTAEESKMIDEFTKANPKPKEQSVLGWDKQGKPIWLETKDGKLVPSKKESSSPAKERIQTIPDYTPSNI
jgi:hypothetical protein